MPWKPLCGVIASQLSSGSIFILQSLYGLITVQVTVEIIGTIAPFAMLQAQ